MYFLVILDVWGTLVIYTVLRFDRSLKPFKGFFGHFRGLGDILVVFIVFNAILVNREVSGVFSFLHSFSFEDILVILEL